MKAFVDCHVRSGKAFTFEKENYSRFSKRGSWSAKKEYWSSRRVNGPQNVAIRFKLKNFLTSTVNKQKRGLISSLPGWVKG